MSDLGFGVANRISDQEDESRRAMENETEKIRVAMPGKIIDFNEKKQTATVQPLIKEYVRGKWESLPQLLDVPCFFPRAGGYCLTFPVKPGDEVEIMFNDMCIDSWWQSSEEQTQVEIRRHDLSDAMCFLGITSVPKAVTEYSTNSVMLRNEDKDSFFEIVDDDKTINIIGAEKINVTAVDDINVKTDANINVKAGVNITILAGGNIDITSDGSMSITTPTLTINADITHNGSMVTSGTHVDSVGPHCSC